MNSMSAINGTIRDIASMAPCLANTRSGLRAAFKEMMIATADTR